MKQKNIKTVSLVVTTLTYLIIGAAFFDYFESSLEDQQHTILNTNITIFRHKHGMNTTEFNKLWNTILWQKPYKAGNQWKFLGSLYFCTLVVTLIGYGHSTPRTIYGKSFCIFYTLVGIPIFLIMFQSVGERLNSLIVYVFSYFKKKLRFKNPEVSMVELIGVEFGLSITITIFAMYVFVRSEGWTYFDAAYYCFITLTTIGFGDMVPLQTNNNLSDNFSYACFTIFFILIGLTTLASSMNLLVLRLASISAEEQVQEKIDQDEARRQMAHLDGDVINFKNRSSAKEGPDQVQDNISVCSCNCFDYEVCQTERYRVCFSKKKRYKNSTQSDTSDMYTCNVNNINKNASDDQSVTNESQNIAKKGFFQRPRQNKVKRLDNSHNNVKNIKKKSNEVERDDEVNLDETES